ncbi:MAG: hypothetical protein JSR98_06045 [Proteobacteria bacterium]|nr:hypothetical protein [Pseudomonadota bacterium]
MTYQYDRDPGVIYEDRAMPAIVYGLYILGLFHGLTLIIGLVMAYALRGGAGPANASHYDYQIRTFWTALVGMLAGCAILAVGGILTVILIGFPIMFVGGAVCFLSWLWAMVRCIIGAVRLAEGRPIDQPYGYRF